MVNSKRSSVKTTKTTKTKTSHNASHKIAKKPKSFLTHAKNNTKDKSIKCNGQRLFIAVYFSVFPLIIGIISFVLSSNAMKSFGSLSRPPFTPPAWLFPVAWTVLYILMGIASYLIYQIKPKNPAEQRFKYAELSLFFIQLAFNFLWSILFFRFGLYYFAFGWLIAMWLMILAIIIMTFKNCKPAAFYLLPYLLWCTFAAYLNIAVAILN